MALPVRTWLYEAGGVGGAVRPGQGRNGRTGTIGLDDMVGGLHSGGHIHHHAVFQLAVHILFAGGHGLLTLRPMLGVVARPVLRKYRLV